MDQYFVLHNNVVLKFIVTYTAPVWGMAVRRYTNLQHLQNKYLKVIYKLPLKTTTKIQHMAVTMDVIIEFSLLDAWPCKCMYVQRLEQAKQLFL
jgi:hypothetical protein